MTRRSLYEMPEYYDIIAKQSTNTEKEVDFLDDILKPCGAKTVLDVACGTGRHSIALAERGYRVTGLDNSEHQLKRAQELAATKGIFVDWKHQDANAMLLDEKVDGAICMWSTIGEEPLQYQKVIRGVKRNLVSGGQFIVDNKSWLDIPPSGQDSLVYNVVDGKKTITISLSDRYTEHFRIRDVTYLIEGTGFKDLCITHILDERTLRDAMESEGFSVDVYHEYSARHSQDPKRIQIVGKLL